MKGKRLFYNASKRAAEELRDIPIGFAAAVKDYIRQSIPCQFFLSESSEPSGNSTWQRFKNYASKHPYKTAAMIVVPIIHNVVKTILYFGPYIGVINDPVYGELFGLGETYVGAFLPYIRPYIDLPGPSHFNLNPRRPLHIDHPAASYPLGLGVDAIIDYIIYRI